MNNNKEKTCISTNLKYLRTINNKSLNDIANVCNKTDVAVHYWENGTREPNAVDIAKLSNYYNITVDDLLLKDLRNDDAYKMNDFSELDNALFSKAKELSDEDKIVVMNVIDSIKRNIDNENK